MATEKTGMELDTKDFEVGVRKLMKQVHPKAVERGLFKACGRLVDDAVEKEPRVPIDEGTLRGSWSIFVQGKFASKGPSPEATTTHKEPGFRPMDFVGTVGFNTEYAAYLHEHPELDFGSTAERKGKPVTSGTGAKFLEKKLANNGKAYMKIVADEIRKEYDKGGHTS